jgi:hypothetical protein
LVCGCGSDKFAGSDAASDATQAQDAPMGCGHELCDNFDTPGEVPGGPPWTTRNGPLSIVPLGFSKPNALEVPATLSSVVVWAVPKVGGISCQAMVWIDPALPGGDQGRNRTIVIYEIDVLAEAGMQTWSYTISIDPMHVTGIVGQRGTLNINTWGQSGTPAPTSMWLPFKLDITVGSNVTLSGSVGPSALSGSPMLPGKILSARIMFGHASLDNMHMDIVRWDDITCDSK